MRGNDESRGARGAAAAPPGRTETLFRALAAGLAVLLAAVPATALPPGPQGARPRVSSRLSQGIVKLGQQVHLEIEVEGTESARIVSLPEVSGLSIGPAGRPSHQYYQSWVNGRYESSTRVTWVVPVRPFGTGEFDLPPAVLDVDGRAVETRPLHLDVVEDMRGADLGYFDVRPSSPFVVEGQPFSVDLRFGFDAALDRKINYVNLSLPWWGALSGAVPLDKEFPVPEDAKRTEVAINGSERATAVMTSEEVRGRPFFVLTLRQGYVATRTGTLDLSGNIFEFARVVDSGGFFTSRRKKAESYFVTEPEVSIEVVPLPEEGRPFDFGGAIGALTAKAETDTRDVTVGDSIKLTVEWTGEGNFEFFEIPDPGRDDDFDGFRVYGSTEESKGFDHRRVVYDLAPLSDAVDAIPPVEMPYYDPSEGAYLTAETAHIPIRVRPLEDARALVGETEERFAADLHDVATSLSPPEDERALRRPGRAPVLAALGGVPLVWLVGRTWLRRRRGDPDAPAERRRRRARRALARDLGRARSVEDELAALHAFLAARTREPDQAWVGRDIDDYLDPDDDAVLELRELLADLEGAAYGGRERAHGSRDVLRVADRLLAEGL